MREILFRAKAINRDKGYHRTNYKNGDWVYGLVIRLYDDRFENLPAEMKDLSGVNGIEVNHETIGQFTGLTDKNGVKIFEGDIVKYNELHGKVVYDDDIATVIVYFNNKWNTDFSNICAKYSGVIGNIHDNPELLEDGENDA